MVYDKVNNISYVDPPDATATLPNVCVKHEYPSSNDSLYKTHIIELNYTKTYEVVIISGDSAQQHPWHIHGYYVDFIGYGTYDIKSPFDYNKNPLFALNESVAVISRGDSFTVPNASYVVFRFTANNAGPWFFHCHVEWHLSLGMAVVFSVVDRPTHYPDIICDNNPNSEPADPIYICLMFWLLTFTILY